MREGTTDDRPPTTATAVRGWSVVGRRWSPPASRITHRPLLSAVRQWPEARGRKDKALSAEYLTVGWSLIQRRGMGCFDLCWSPEVGATGFMWMIQMLGGLAARRSQQEVARFRTQKAASLLAFLAFHPAP